VYSPNFSILQLKKLKYYFKKWILPGYRGQKAIVVHTENRHKIGYHLPGVHLVLQIVSQSHLCFTKSKAVRGPREFIACVL
jgi:hypothetical protein